jgi:hypothetical protein
MYAHNPLLSPRLALAAGAVLVLLVFASPSMAQGGPPSTPPGNGPNVPVTPAAAPLPEAEAQSLLHMREEEKLARDVYRFLYEKWNLRTFRQIAASEQRHFEALGTLIARYGLTDPAKAEAGQFTSTALQSLYHEMIAKGSGSILAAVEVGVAIEKLDIDDLEQALKTLTNADLKRAYTNLLNGSYSHLDAFEAHLEVLCVNP